MDKSSEDIKLEIRIKLLNAIGEEVDSSTNNSIDRALKLSQAYNLVTYAPGKE